MNMTPESSAVGSFELEIQFTGICVHVVGKNSERVTVVLPDGRAKSSEISRHADDTPADPHVATLAFDLAHLGGASSDVRFGAVGMEPAFEVVHQLVREEIVLDLPYSEARQEGPNHQIGVPDFSKFAGLLALNRRTLNRQPDPTVLSRLTLRGGLFTTSLETEPREIAGDYHADGVATWGRYGSTVRWTRTVYADALTVRLESFDDEPLSRSIRLIPLPRVNKLPGITLRIANLCHNPLDWAALDAQEPDETMTKSEDADEDFKWCYRLMSGVGTKLPIPIRKRDDEQGKVDRCFGARIDEPA